MEWGAHLSQNVDDIFNTKWDERAGNVVPEAESIALADGTVKLNATFLYADLAGSSQIANICPWETTAKIIRAYLDCATRLVRAYGGNIRSFDGDRVMGVFIGDNQTTDATKCAREIFWSTENIIGPKASQSFPSIKNNNIKVRQCVGIDTGIARAVRAGIRNNNDIIWVGRPPSFAAKLSDIRAFPYCVYLSAASFNKLPTDQKVFTGGHLWEYLSFNFAGTTETIYRTKYMLKP